MPRQSRPPRYPSTWNHPGGRSAFERIIKIHYHLGNRHTVTARSLGEEFEISSRTIKRDIEFMRDRCGSPIAWDAVRGTYYYTQPCDFLPLLRIDGHEALALSLASKTFASWGGTPLGKALTSVFGKFSAIAGPHVSLPASELSACLFNPEDDSAKTEHHHFGRLLEEIFNHRELTLTYRKPLAAHSELRTVHPLHLAYLDHAWMLVAHDTGKKAWRNFLVARIESIATTGRTFTPPANEKIRRSLAGSMGRFTGEGDIEVRLAFDADIAGYIRERPWHHSQQHTEIAGGSLEVTLRLNNLIDVQRRLLSCGRHVRVIAPATLRASIRNEVEAMLILHLD
jgi:proteasome accessory factor B